MKEYDRRLTMKIWHVILLAMLLVMTPLFSSCDFLGLGSSQQKQQQEYYRKQLEAYQKVQEANQKAQEEYNKNSQEGLQKYLDEYQKYQQQVQQQQLAQLGQGAGTASANQTTGNTTGGD
jgi:uncharacterized protein YlxW (UPF0749 family)